MTYTAARDEFAALARVTYFVRERQVALRCADRLKFSQGKDEWP